MPPFIGPINIEVSTLVVGKVEKLKEMLLGALFAQVGYVLKTKILLIDEIVFCKNEGLVLFDKNRIVEWPTRVHIFGNNMAFLFSKYKTFLFKNKCCQWFQAKVSFCFKYIKTLKMTWKERSVIKSFFLEPFHNDGCSQN